MKSRCRIFHHKKKQENENRQFYQRWGASSSINSALSLEPYFPVSEAMSLKYLDSLSRNLVTCDVFDMATLERKISVGSNSSIYQKCQSFSKRAKAYEENLPISLSPTIDSDFVCHLLSCRKQKNNSLSSIHSRSVSKTKQARKMLHVWHVILAMHLLNFF